MLSHYFDLASEVVGRYGGTIEKFIGDAVMAVWGVPQAHEDDAERAVLAGLELVDAVTVLGEGIQARAGVMTGEAAATLGAQNQGMVAGDLVNTAARLQSVAAPGTVLVGERTRDAAGSAIRFEAAGPQTLKGKDAPVAAWRALRAVGDSRGAPAADALEAPFVGRADELRLLKETYHATGRERRARLVSLVGQAGIGKSRLAWELETYLDGLVETVRWHRGRSPAYGEGVTFWALGEMVRRRAGLTEGDDEPTTRAAVARMVEEHVPDEAERRWIEPRLLVLLGLAEAPSGGREELFAAWRTFFERLAADGDGRPRVRGHPLGRRRAAGLHRAPAGLEPRPADLRDHARAPGAAGATAGVGDRPARRHRGARRAAGGRVHARAARGPGPRAGVGGGRRRSSPAPTASRSTPWRRSGCWSPTVAWPGPTMGPTGRRASSATSRSRPPSTRSSRRGSTPCRADGRSLLQVASVLGQTFSETALAEVSGQTRRVAGAPRWRSCAVASC